MDCMGYFGLILNLAADESRCSPHVVGVTKAVASVTRTTILIVSWTKGLSNL